MLLCEASLTLFALGPKMWAICLDANGARYGALATGALAVGDMGNDIGNAVAGVYVMGNNRSTRMNGAIELVDNGLTLRENTWRPLRHMNQRGFLWLRNGRTYSITLQPAKTNFVSNILRGVGLMKKKPPVWKAQRVLQ